VTAVLRRFHLKQDNPFSPHPRKDLDPVTSPSTNRDKIWLDIEGCGALTEGFQLLVALGSSYIEASGLFDTDETPLKI
jgi:hypothetical protein